MDRNPNTRRAQSQSFRICVENVEMNGRKLLDVQEILR